jgi:hypothetical protein
MLYKDGVKITEFKPYTAVLEELFPNYFDKKNPQGIMIHYASEEKVLVRKRMQGAKESQQKLNTPSPTSLKSVATVVNEDGVSIQIAYTPVAPIKDNKADRLIYNKASITLEEGLVLHPVVDLEKLIFLYFYSNSFKNGHGETGIGRFEFDMPDREAIKLIAKGKRKNEYEGLIFHGGLTKAQVEEAMKILNIPIDARSEELNRVRLFNNVCPSNTFNEDSVAIVDGVRGSQTSGNMEDTKALVDSAIERGVLERKEEGWKFNGQKGVNAQVFSTVETIEELYEVVNKNAKLRERFEKLTA